MRVAVASIRENPRHQLNVTASTEGHQYNRTPDLNVKEGELQKATIASIGENPQPRLDDTNTYNTKNKKKAAASAEDLSNKNVRLNKKRPNLFQLWINVYYVKISLFCKRPNVR